MRVLECETDERRLIEAAQRDPHRFAELYENNFERVYAFLIFRLRNRAEAEDLTAEVFHRALAGIQNFQWQGVPFAAWLLGIAAKVLADRWDRQSKRKEVPVDELSQAGIDTAIEQRTVLFQLVDALPADQRHVVLRRFIDQRTIREIAHEMGRSEGAIKQLQFRALQTLRAQMRCKYV